VRIFRKPLPQLRSPVQFAAAKRVQKGRVAHLHVEVNRAKKSEGEMGFVSRLAVFACLLMVASASAAVTGSTRYNATLIPKLPGYNDQYSSYETSDISPNGRYVVGRAYNFLTQQYRAFVYSDGVTQFIPGLENINS
jgi:hypothetical protein